MFRQAFSLSRLALNFIICHHFISQIFINHYGVFILVGSILLLLSWFRTKYLSPFQLDIDPWLRDVLSLRQDCVFDIFIFWDGLLLLARLFNLIGFYRWMEIAVACISRTSRAYAYYASAIIRCNVLIRTAWLVKIKWLLFSN